MLAVQHCVLKCILPFVAIVKFACEGMKSNV